MKPLRARQPLGASRALSPLRQYQIEQHGIIKARRKSRVRQLACYYGADTQVWRWASLALNALGSLGARHPLGSLGALRASRALRPSGTLQTLWAHWPR